MTGRILGQRGFQVVSTDVGPHGSAMGRTHEALPPPKKKPHTKKKHVIAKHKYV